MSFFAREDTKIGCMAKIRIRDLEKLLQNILCTYMVICYGM